MKKSLKKLVVICSSFALSLGITSNMYASTSQSSTAENTKLTAMFNTAAAQAAQGNRLDRCINVTVKNSSGQRFLIKAFKYGETVKELTPNQYTETYVMSSDEKYVTPITSNNSDSPMVRASIDFSDGGWDKSISVKASLSLTYSQYSDKYVLNSVRGSWTVDDATVSLSNRYLIYTCRDKFDGSQCTEQLPSSNYFNYNTNYTKQIQNAPGSILAARSEVKLTHGSSNWIFSFPAIKFNNGVEFGAGSGK